MKILRLINSMDPMTGGPCQGIRNSIGELAKIGVQNEVVCLDEPNAAYLGKDSFIIHALGPSKGPWRYSADLTPWLTANLPRFDVLIVHGLWLYPSYAARKVWQKHRKQTGVNTPKLFVMPHGHLDPYFQEAASRRLKAIRNWVYWKLIENKVVRDADALLFTSETELLMARLPFRPYQPQREINVGYGIQPPPPFTPTMLVDFQKRCPGLHNAPYIIFLSRIHEKKGTDLLVKAYADLLKEGSKSTAAIPKLVIAGPGLDTPYGIMLQKMVADDMQLKEQVFFPGMLTGDTKWGSLYGCQAFVLPSHQENFGIAVVEALACGKAVLISNQVNIWKEIIEANGGISFGNTQEGVSAGLQQWLLQSESQKIEMGQKGYEFFTKEYAMGPAAHRLLAAISA